MEELYNQLQTIDTLLHGSSDFILTSQAVGPDFSPVDYFKQRAGIGESDSLPKTKRSKIPYAAAASLALLTGASALANDAQPEFEIQYFDAEIEGQDYPVTVISDQPVNSVDEAKQLANNGKNATALLYGDFSPEKIADIRTAIKKAYAIDPEIIEQLEPVFVHYNVEGIAYTKSIPITEDNLDATIKKNAQVKKSKNPSYTNYHKNLSENYIPTDEIAYQQIMQRIADYQTNMKEGYDMMVFSNTTPFETIVHELGHASLYDSKRHHDISTEIAKTPRPSSHVFGGQEYAQQREEEVQQWRNNQIAALEKKIAQISEYGPLTKEQEKIVQGLHAFGEEGFIQRYRDIVNSRSVVIYTAERMAEAFESIVLDHMDYREGKRARKRANKQRDPEYAEIHELLDDVLGGENEWRQFQIMEDFLFDIGCK